MVPDFSLSARDGERVRISEYRGRRSLVLIFLDADGGGLSELLQGLAAEREELEWAEAQVLVIAGLENADHYPNEPNLSTPFGLRLLLDPGFTVHQQFGTGRGWAVYLTDRYGEIYSVAWNNGAIRRPGRKRG